MGLFKSRKQKEQEQNLLNMQNYLFGLQTSRLEKTPKQILNKATSYVNERRERAVKAATKINAADNPKSFFDALDSVNQVVAELEYLNNLAPGIVNIEEIKTTLFKDLPDDIDKMIDKSWEKHRLDALTVVKEDSKKKKLGQFFELMDIYKSKMYPQNIEHIERIRKEYENLFA